MTVYIRKIENTEHDHFAYIKTLCGKGTYFLYFVDDIWGAVLLNDFITMVKNYFSITRVRVSIVDKNVKLKNEVILEILKQ